MYVFMMLYTVGTDNDMGHFVVIGNVPRHIKEYVYAQSSRYLDEEIRMHTHHGFSTVHWHIKPGFQTVWRYHLGNDTVEVTWPRRTIDETTIVKQQTTPQGRTIISTTHP